MAVSVTVLPLAMWKSTRAWRSTVPARRRRSAEVVVGQPRRQPTDATAGAGGETRVDQIDRPVLVRGLDHRDLAGAASSTVRSACICR